MEYLVNIFNYDDLEVFYYFILDSSVELTNNEIIDCIIPDHMPKDTFIYGYELWGDQIHDVDTNLSYDFQIKKIKDIQIINHNKKIKNNCISEFSEST